jgi:flavin reductase (DIM6/NTAB) family NADH-FMN oxidoreductase RutF
MRTEGIGEHLVFVWSPAGYAIEVRAGQPPSPGASVEEGDRRHRVTKVAASPLPGDTRACAYLLPADGNGDAPSVTAHAHEELAPTIAVAVAPESDVLATDDFLTLLGRYPEGASVVTVDANGRRFGLKVGSLVSLSLDPPLVGFTIPNEEAIHEVLPIAGGCAISILAGGQEWLAEYFETSARPIAMWHGLAAEEGAAGAPLFVGALGWLECSLAETVDLGSETLFVCGVRQLESGPEAPALLRRHGRYGSV